MVDLEFESRRVLLIFHMMVQGIFGKYSGVD